MLSQKKHYSGLNIIIHLIKIILFICEIIHGSARRVISSLERWIAVIRLLEISSDDVIRLRAQLNEQYNCLQKKKKREKRRISRRVSESHHQAFFFFYV